MRRTADSITLVVLAAAVVIAKAPAFGTPAYWDEMGWLGQAYALADGSLIQAMPGFRPAQAFVGHPPGLHVMFALAAKIFGASVVTAHILSTAYAAAGVCFTYLLGALLFDRWTARVAAVLLAVSPMYFAQAGMFLADLPAAALAAGTVYFALSGRGWAYVVCGSAMVFTKETSAAIVVALLMYDVALRQPRVRLTSSTLATRAVPLVVLATFFTWQKLATGSWWLVYAGNAFQLSWLQTSAAVIRHEARRVSEWLFVAQSRSVLTIVMAISFLTRFGQWRRREIWLLVLVVLMGTYPFILTAQFFLPRYLLPTLPFFYLLGARAVVELFRGRPWQLAAGTAITILMIVSLFHQPFFGTAEMNLRYRDVVRSDRDIATVIAREFPGSRVLTAWPHTTELNEPRFGYVSRPLSVVPVTMGDDGRTPSNLDRDFAQADAVWVTQTPTSPGMTELRNYAISAGWRLIRRVVREPAVSELYAR